MKFLRAAYAWLLVSLTLFVLLPVHQRILISWLAPGSEAAQLHFSHAYFGATRHAITVGFISLMIVGVAARVVPTLEAMSMTAPTKLPSMPPVRLEAQPESRPSASAKETLVALTDLSTGDRAAWAELRLWREAAA